MLDAKWKIFQMAAATCNFTQTAAALGMSQPNVTGQIRKLEQELGVALFIRDGRQLRLTRPGRVLLLEAESLLALSENAVRMARNAAADVLSFQLGATMTAGGYVLPPLAAEFMREHANRRIHLCIANTEEISDKLKKRFFDLALVEGAFDRELFLSRTLLADELLLAGSPRLPFFRGGKVELAELAKSNLPLLLREKGSGTRFYTDRFFREHGFRPERSGRILELNSPDAIKSMLRTGFGVTVISELAVRDELKAGTLAAARFAEGEVRREMNFIYLPNDSLKFNAEFIAYCRRKYRP